MRTTKTKKRYIYCEARSDELEQRTRDGWELVNEQPTFDTNYDRLPAYGPMRHGYLLRREEPPPELVQVQEHLARVQAELQQARKRNDQTEKTMRDILGLIEDVDKSWSMQQSKPRNKLARLEQECSNLRQMAVHVTNALRAELPKPPDGAVVMRNVKLAVGS